MVAQSTYVLSTEKEKLAVRARFFNRQSKPFLNLFIRPGQQVFELGCGMGGATSLIVDILDNIGFIEAVDMNAEYVDYVRNKLASDGYENFSVNQQTAENIVLEKNKYDVVYGRAVLHHIPTAKNVIQKLLNATKPGGLIAFEEPIMGTMFSQPEVKEYAKLFGWYITLGKSRGCDYSIGKSLPLYFQSFGIKILRSQISQIALINQREREAHLELIDTIQPQLIEEKIACIDEINQVKKSMEELVYSDRMMFPSQFCQILGQKIV